MLQILTKNYFPGRNGYTPKWLILHGTAGGSSAQAVANYFISTEGTPNPVSSNYIIGQDGTVVQSVLENNAAYGNGVLSIGHDHWWSTSINPNLPTISIEHVKPDDANATALTPAQQSASFALIKDICTRNNIPMRLADASGGITGHYSIDPVNRARCPGTFPWDELLAYLQEDTMPYRQIALSEVATWFSDAGGGRWRRISNPNITMFGAHLNYWRWNNGIETLGLPLSNEMVIDQTHSQVTAVVYERGICFYDPNRYYDKPIIPADQPEKTVYRAHIDAGYGQQLIAAPLLKSLQDQVAQLQKQIAALSDTDVVTLLQAMHTIQTTATQALGG
jgi:N-acetyl-anhydromuramyl-L-alanine amidase AmpD